MRLSSSFIVVFTVAAFGIPASLCIPTTLEREDDSSLSRPVSSAVYKNVNHVIIRMNNAVQKLDRQMEESIKSDKFIPTLAPAEKGLGLLSLFLGDATAGLNRGTMKINNVQEVYQTLVELGDSVVKSARNTEKIKDKFGAQLGSFAQLTIMLLQGLVYEFSEFHDALSSFLKKNKVTLCVSGPVRTSVCALDKAIQHYDPKFSLTNEAFCKMTNTCELGDLPKKIHSIGQSHVDVRVWLQEVYSTQCYKTTTCDSLRKIEDKAQDEVSLETFTPKWVVQ